MAAYQTNIKTFVIKAPDKDEISTTAATYSAKINDYIETLDSTSETVLQFDTTQMSGGAILVTILHSATA